MATWRLKPKQRVLIQPGQGSRLNWTGDPAEYPALAEAHFRATAPKPGHDAAELVRILGLARAGNRRIAKDAGTAFDQCGKVRGAPKWRNEALNRASSLRA